MKFWKGPKHLNILLTKVWIFVGLFGVILGLLLRNWREALIMFFVMLGGGLLHGFQVLAWKQWEERKKKQDTTS